MMMHLLVQVAIWSIAVVLVVIWTVRFPLNIQRFTSRSNRIVRTYTQRRITSSTTRNSYPHSGIQRRPLGKTESGAALVELAVTIGALTTLCIGLVTTSGASRRRLGLTEIASISVATAAEAPDHYLSIDTLGVPHCVALSQFVRRSLNSSGFHHDDIDFKIEISSIDIDSGVDQVLRSAIAVRLARKAPTNTVMPLREVAESQALLRPNITPGSVGLLVVGEKIECLQQ